MKKVLFVATVTRHINAFHIPYLKWFKANNYEIHVASNGDEKIPYCDKHFNLNFARFPLKKQNFKAYKDLKKIIQENKYELIHCHTPVGGVLTRLAARKARKKGTKVIYTAHGFHFYKGAPLLNWLIYYPIEKFLAKYTDVLITINQEDYELANKKFKTLVKYIPGVGVEKEKFNCKISEDEKKCLLKELNINQSNYIITIIGELNKNKNQILAIETMKELINDYPNFKLLLIGRGSLEAVYKEKIESINLQNNVMLLGYRDDIPQILSISNVLLSLSYREGLPVNVMEALMLNIPAIVTNCRGSKDLISNGKNGYVLANNNVNDLKNAIIQIYKNPIIMDNNEFCKKYAIDNIIERYTEIYNEMLQRT